MKRMAAVIAVALSSCTYTAASGHHQSNALDQVLAFAEPARCQPGRVHDRLLTSMVTGDGEEGYSPGRLKVPSRHAQAFGSTYVQRKDHYTLIGVPVRGSLFGLPLVNIEQSLPHGGDPGGVEYRFRAPIETVERTLVSRGFPVRSGEAVTLGPPDVYEHLMKLEADAERPDHALLSCWLQ